MTNTYKNVYIEDTATIAGAYEAEGPLAKYFDKSYTKDLYCPSGNITVLIPVNSAAPRIGPSRLARPPNTSTVTNVID